MGLFALGENDVFANPGVHFKKVMVIVLENTDYDEALTQPFLSQLVAKGALLSNFYAEAHPSQPNYIALISGSTNGVSSDSLANLNGQQIGDLLEAKGLQWKAYAEQYPGNCFLGATSGKFARKHVPFLSFKNIQNDKQRCNRIVDASELSTDISNGTLPDFSLYSPDLDNDGHDTGAAYADQWLSSKFGPLLQNSSFSKDLLLVVTFDESESLGPNHVFTVLYGDGIAPGVVSNDSYTHYSLLRTIEDEFGLGTLSQGDSQASAISGIWK